MPQNLPPNPSLPYLKDQAKRLLQAFSESKPDALALFRSHHPRAKGLLSDALKRLEVRLGDAQLVLAREHGLRSWPQLKRFVETHSRPTDPDAAALQEELLDAARTGDAKLLCEILDAHPELKDTADECGWTLLCHAALHGYTEVIEALLQRKADVKKDQPSHYAGQRGHREICRMLVAAGAVDDYAQTHERDAIEAWRCALGFDAKGLREILSRRRDLAKSTGPMKRSMLHEAATNNDVDVLKVLLEFGADPNATDARGETAFSRAASHGQRAAVELLADHGTACTIFTAVQFGLLARAKSILKQDPEQAKKTDGRGFSLLRVARQYNQKEIARYLLSQGADDSNGSAGRWLSGKEIRREDWRGTTFQNINFNGSLFDDIDMSDVAFQNINFKGSTFINMNFANVQIDDAVIDGMKIYGIEVRPLIMAELEKRRKG